MKLFEKNIKDRFKDASSLEGLNPDNLWSQIDAAIETNSTKRRFVFFRWRYLLLLLSLFIVGGITIWNIPSEIALSEKENSSSNSIVAFQNDEKNIKENKNDKSTDNDNVDENNEKENFSTITKKNTKEITSSPTLLSKNETSNQIYTKQTNESSINDVTYHENQHNNNTISQAKSIVKSNSEKQSINQINEDNDVFQIDNITQIGSIVKSDWEEQSNINKYLRSDNSTPNQHLEGESLFIGKKIKFTKLKSISSPLPIDEQDRIGINGIIITSKNSTKNSTFSLGLFSGSHTLKNKFLAIVPMDNERKNLLNDNFHLEPGYSVAIEASLLYKENILITSGFEYVKSKSEFNFTQFWDTIIVNPNSHVGALTDASARRTVRHHNKINYFSIPILLGYKKSFRKIDLGMSTGVGLNFTQSQTGKSLNSNNQITIYPIKENKELPVATFFLSYHLRPYVSYDLSDKISFQFRTDFRFQNYRKSDFYQLKYRSTFFGLSGGVRYKF
ncbi:hypothetical protein OAU89_02745 [bacterium]|nr:hypothetical protein [bacterium]